MSLLELEQVVRVHREGQLERIVLREVSLRLDAGELAVVWGLRGSGRSTLLRVAAGIDAPDGGAVRFDGRDLALHAEDVLGAGIGYVQKGLGATGSQPVLEQVMVSLLARGIAPGRARTRAREALERAGCGECASRRLSTLATAEATRVALARVLALQPRLLVIDEPTAGVELAERDGILALLRSLANDGVAVLASTTEPAGLAGADRTLALSEGELRGPRARELAAVLPLRRPAARRVGA